MTFRCLGDINNPLDCSVELIQEGKFRHGLMDGYCRSFDGVDEGMVEIGFFKEGRPLGKYQQFEIRSGNLVAQGIKDGDDLIKQVEIADFMTRNLTSDLVQLEKSVKNDKQRLSNVRLAQI